MGSSGNKPNILPHIHFLQFIAQFRLKYFVGIVLTDFGRVGSAVLAVFAGGAGGYEFFEEVSSHGSLVGCEFVDFVIVIVIVGVGVALLEYFLEEFVDAGCCCIHI